jgi:hypothetical protein
LCDRAQKKKEAITGMLPQCYLNVNKIIAYEKNLHENADHFLRILDASLLTGRYYFITSM